MRHLLAATCLTAASVGAAGATTITESTDFSDTFATATALPAGTDIVNGQVINPQTDLFDYFKFSGLTPLTLFNVHFFTPNAGLVVGGEVLDSSANSFGSIGFDPENDVAGTVPSDGILVVRIFAQEGGPYTATLTTGSAVPEPSTAPLAGAGMLVAGALDWWRRRQKR
jgi:hypothetical protein